MSRATFDILVDYDDVLYPWSKRAHQVSTGAGITNGNAITQWAFYKDYGCTEQELWDVLNAATITGELYNGWMDSAAIAQLRRLRGYGHRIHIVTARGYGEHGELIRTFTREQIALWGVQFDSLHFEKDKTKVQADFAIDDGVHNYEALDAVGVGVFLLDQPHNQGHSGRRVHSVKEFAELVLAFAAATPLTAV